VTISFAAVGATEPLPLEIEGADVPAGIDFKNMSIVAISEAEVAK
jgi:hypothetical protein